MPENLRQIAATTSKDVKVASVRIALQLLLSLKGETLHASAHVRVTHRDPNAASSRYRDHARNAFKAAAIADEGAPAWIRTRASFNSTSITAEPEQLDDVDEEGAAGAASMITGENPQASASAAWRISRRHLKTRLVQTSSRRATSAITAPGSEIAARIRARSWSLHRRRRSAPEINVIRPMLCS
ncbi:hypothetical protein [Rhodoblastus sp.]|uniref:hypothetical protein n=1 Tax=Rhodoblastus sp. TaxID=1962975 RepID=UPI003F965EBB